MDIDIPREVAAQPPNVLPSEGKAATVMDVIDVSPPSRNASLKAIGLKVRRFPEDTNNAMQEVKSALPGYAEDLDSGGNLIELESRLMQSIVKVEAVIAAAKTAYLKQPNLVQDTLKDARQTLTELYNLYKQVKRQMPLVSEVPPHRVDWNLVQVKELCKEQTIPQLEEWVRVLKVSAKWFTPTKHKEILLLKDQIHDKRNQIDALKQVIEHDSEFSYEQKVSEPELNHFETAVHEARNRLPDLEKELQLLEGRFALLIGPEEDFRTLNYVEPYLLHKQADQLIHEVQNRRRYKHANKDALLQEARELLERLQFFESKQAVIPPEIAHQNHSDFEHLKRQIIPHLEKDVNQRP